MAAGAEEMGVSIREIAQDAVAAITRIGATIHAINDFQTTIASAVEEQTATTAEMARSPVTEAANGSPDIAANISGVSSAAESTASALDQSTLAIRELAGMAAQMKSEISHFAY